MIQKLVGLSFNPVSGEGIHKGTPVQLIHDKDNKYSSRAISVICNGKHIGHIGEKNNVNHEEIFDNLPIEGTVYRVAVLAEGESFKGGSYEFKTGEITSIDVEISLASDNQNGVVSFNEPTETINFDPVEHEYTYNGEKLTGGTTYIKRWIKPFDKEMISGFVAKSLGYPQKDVLNMWEGTGNVSSLFGKSIHEALEQYDKFKALGAVMQEKKDLEYNKALPTHPLLRGVVEEFLRRFTHKDDDIVAEALVSNVKLGLCGYIDRLKIIDRDKKICRVQDYKINIDSDVEDKNTTYLGQFADLPKNKLSKYQLQMSFYARLLELSGWKVEGLDAFVYEDEWKHYPMPVLKLDF